MSEQFLLRGAVERALLISLTNSGASVRVCVTSGPLSKSMDKKEQWAAEWSLWERVTGPSVAAT